MPCCGQPPAGYATEWQLRIKGKVVATGTQAEVQKASADEHGGAGVVLSVLKRLD